MENTLVLNKNAFIMDTMNALPTNVDHLSEEQLHHLILSIKMDEYKPQIKSIIKNANFDISKKVEMWLKDKAPDTIRMYKLYIEEFMSYLGETHILNVTTFIVDEFISTYLTKFSENKARLIFSSISSFYSALYRWGDVSTNPFKGAKVRKKINIDYKTDKQYVPPTKEEIDLLMESFIGNKHMWFVLYIMEKFGVRVGFFKEAVFSEDKGIIESTSKGKLYRINVMGNIIVRENKELFGTFNTNTISSSFNRKVLKLYKEGVFDRKFNIHSIRDYVACREYSRDKDIYRVSRMLNHSSVTVTERYLKGLKYESR